MSQRCHGLDERYQIRSQILWVIAMAYVVSMARVAGLEALIQCLVLRGIDFQNQNQSFESRVRSQIAEVFGIVCARGQVTRQGDGIRFNDLFSDTDFAWS